MPTHPNHSNSAGSRQATHVVDEHAYDHVRRDGERLDCYQVAMQFNSLAARLVPRGHRELRDQLTRAGLSIVLNIAESTGRSGAAEKGHFVAIAHGSAAECAAIVEVLLSSGIASIGACREARAVLIRIVQMLRRLDDYCRAEAGQ